jgi:hypothetical protein
MVDVPHGLSSDLVKRSMTLPLANGRAKCQLHIKGQQEAK